MSDRPDEELWMEDLAARTELGTAHAPSRLKSLIYSRLVQEQALTPGLIPLSACRAHGYGLCVFEEFVRIAPLGERVQKMNPCRICHARVLGEGIENAPLYWPNCPYAEFQNR